MLDAQPGICIRCDTRGAAGTPCDTRSCKKTRTHLLPDEYAARANDAAYLSEPLIGRVVDDWLVVDVLGRGGFGQVFLVLQLPIFLKAALKLLHRDPVQADESPSAALARRMAQSKFTGEVQALATLTHPGIVRLMKYGEFEGAPYLVMELAPGRVMADAMASGPMVAEVYRPDHAQHILRQLTNALEAAHLQKIVHRDVKPANIILQALPGDPFFVRVLDFGIAKFLSEGSRTSVSAGTPIYMAPEQFDRQKIGPWSDLYAVGVIAYELVFGQPPFNAPTVERVLARKLAPDADPLSDIRGRVAPAIEAFFARALARRPEDRYASATELRYGLDALFEAVRHGDREALFTLGQRAQQASFMDDGALASTDMDVSLAPRARAVETRRRWPWLALAGLAVVGAGVGVTIATSGAPPALTPDETVAQRALPDASASLAAALEPDVTSPADDLAALAPALDEELAIVTAVEVEPDTSDTSDTADAAVEDVAVVALDDTRTSDDTRHAPSRTRPDTSSPPVDVAPTPPEPTIAPTVNAPDTREARPYSFGD